MEKNIECSYDLNMDMNFEIVERKGKGHPDTLADDLGERLSIAYSKYCLEHFGVILHHNFDKVGMMGGISEVGFGIGKIKEPIRVLINGRASAAFGNEIINLREIVDEVVKEFFKEKFPHIENIDKAYKIIWEVASGSSPGAVADADSYRQHWFNPRGKFDLSELNHLNCNDTSMGVAYYGYTDVEMFVLKLEELLNSNTFKSDKPWMGNDIKLMCCKNNNNISLTLCVPQIGIYVNNINEYKENMEVVRATICKLAAEELGAKYNLQINMNMRDRYNDGEKDLYLTYTGSSIEMGDEGFVGRGNRFGGLITPNRFFSMEGIAGKNPVYHTGKMYSVFAYELARLIWENYEVYSEVILVGMTGQPLMNPHHVRVKMDKMQISDSEIEELLSKVSPSKMTENILKGSYRLY